MSVSVIIPDSRDQWEELEAYLVNLHNTKYDDYLELASAYGKASLYFMMWHVLLCARWQLPDFECEYWGLPEGSRVMEHPYCYDFISEVEQLWEEHGEHGLYMECARGFIKTTTSVAVGIQDICKDPNSCWLILSENKILAKAKYRRFRDEIKDNHLLKALYPEIFFKNPERESGSVFTEEYLTVKRSSARAEHTIICKGLERRLPTGDHYPRMYVDDVVNEDSASTPEMRDLILTNFRSAMNLRDNYNFKYLASGTPYHFDDMNRSLMKDGTYGHSIIRPAEDLGTPPTIDDRRIFPAITGKPVFLGPKLLMAQYRAKGDASYNAQMLLDPTGGRGHVIEKDFIVRYTAPPFVEARKYNCHIYVSMDPSSGTGEDPSAIAVMGLGWDKLWRLLDVKLDVLDHEEKALEAIAMAQRWHRSGVHPVLGILVEEVAQSADSFWIRKKLAEIGVNFKVVPVTFAGQGMPKGKGMGKLWTINEYLMPMLRGRKIKFPANLSIKSSMWKGRKNVVDDYLWPREMASLGFSKDDHVMDAMKLLFLPRKRKGGKMAPPEYTTPKKMHQFSMQGRGGSGRGSWMSL